MSFQVYDRQIRLWGREAQLQLSKSSVCLLGTAVAGTEAIRILVLAGVGQFTIVDDSVVTPRDLGRQYSVTSEDVGQCMATVIVKDLSRLSKTVKGEAVIQPVADFINDTYSHCIQHTECMRAEGLTCEESPVPLLSSFSLILCTNLLPSYQQKLEKLSNLLCVPIIRMYSKGMLGSLQINSLTHYYINPPRLTQVTNLFVTEPFPALKEYACKVQLMEMNDTEHAHVPYIIILLKMVEQFKERFHKYPTHEDKDVLNDMLQNERRGINELNFDEALRYVHTIYRNECIPHEAKEVLQVANRLMCREINFIITEYLGVCRKGIEIVEKFLKFWVVCKALWEFHRLMHRLPCSGVLPDMSCATEAYLELKHIYEVQAQIDKEEVIKTAERIREELLQALSVHCWYSEVSIQLEEPYVRWICQYAETMGLVTTTVEEVESSWNEELNQSDSFIHWLVAIEAKERVEEMLSNEAEDVIDSKWLANRVLAEIHSWLSKSNHATHNYVDKVNQLILLGGCEVHTTSCFIGGIAAQESIKLLTHQYRILNNTFIWDALTGEGKAIRV